LSWVFSPDGAEPALSSRRVELWPIMTDLPERRRLYHISTSYPKLSFAIVFSSQVADLGGRRPRARYRQAAQQTKSRISVLELETHMLIMIRNGRSPQHERSSGASTGTAIQESPRLPLANRSVGQDAILPYSLSA
jgi:hypothetical protein